MDPTGPDAAAMYRRAALAAAIAVKGALFGKGGVAAAAAEAAVSQGASPGEAASIAVELERQIARIGPDAVTRRKAFPRRSPRRSGGVLSAAADGALPARRSHAALPRRRLSIPPRSTASLRALSDWEPLAGLAEALGVADPAAAQGRSRAGCVPRNSSSSRTSMSS